MKTRDLIVCSVASLALCGGLLMVSPVFAQENQNETGPQYSTPAEKAQTQQLNQQNADGYVAPAQQVQYDQQHKQYEDQQAQYQQQQDQYQADERSYIHNLHRYDEAKYYFNDYPRAFPYRYNDLHSLTQLSDARDRLSDVPIEGPNGEWVGRERNVIVGLDGHIERVQVALNHRVAIWVDPAYLRYDPEERILYSQLSRSDLWNMPGSVYED